MATNRRNLARLSPAPEIIEWDTDMARVLIGERRRFSKVSLTGRGMIFCGRALQIISVAHTNMK